MKTAFVAMLGVLAGGSLSLAFWNDPSLNARTLSQNEANVLRGGECADLGCLTTDCTNGGCPYFNTTCQTSGSTYRKIRADGLRNACDTEKIGFDCGITVNQHRCFTQLIGDAPCTATSCTVIDAYCGSVAETCAEASCPEPPIG